MHLSYLLMLMNQLMPPEREVMLGSLTIRGKLLK